MNEEYYRLAAKVGFCSYPESFGKGRGGVGKGLVADLIVGDRILIIGRIRGLRG